MGCVLALIAIPLPRLVMAFIFLLTNWLALAFQTILWPILGFLFMPYTTLAYMAAMLNNNHRVDGLWLILLIIAILFDLSAQSHSAHRHRRLIF